MAFQWQNRAKFGEVIFYFLISLQSPFRGCEILGIVCQDSRPLGNIRVGMVGLFL